jgi:hypothetical protein
MFAYLDAGTGSMVIGVVAAGVAGAGVAVRSTLGRFRRNKSSANESGQTVENPGASEATVESSERDSD